LRLDAAARPLDLSLLSFWRVKAKMPQFLTHTKESCRYGQAFLSPPGKRGSNEALAPWLGPAVPISLSTPLSVVTKLSRPGAAGTPFLSPDATESLMLEK
jgi:hypothetical protein